MIHPFLIKTSLLAKAEGLVVKGAVVFLTQLRTTLGTASPAAFVLSTESGPDRVTATTVDLSKSTATKLIAALAMADVKLLRVDSKTHFLGSALEVRQAIDVALRRLQDGPGVVLPLALVGAALVLLWPASGLLAGYPAEMARGAVYAKDCEEAQRRLDMAWKGLQQMEDRNDPNFVKEANKVARIAKQLRDNGCEVL